MPERTENAASVDVCEIAQRVKEFMRSVLSAVELPEGIDVEFCYREGLCELSAANGDETASFTWRL